MSVYLQAEEYLQGAGAVESCLRDPLVPKVLPELLGSPLFMAHSSGKGVASPFTLEGKRVENRKALTSD